jgi:hypothetical protein
MNLTLIKGENSMFKLTVEENAKLKATLNEADLTPMKYADELRAKKDCGSNCSGHCGASCQAACKSTCTSLF